MQHGYTNVSFMEPYSFSTARQTVLYWYIDRCITSEWFQTYSLKTVNTNDKVNLCILSHTIHLRIHTHTKEMNNKKKKHMCT